MDVQGLSRRALIALGPGERASDHATLKDAPLPDTLVIPGGRGLRVPKTQAAVAEWVQERAGKFRRPRSERLKAPRLRRPNLKRTSWWPRPVRTMSGRPVIVIGMMYQ